MAKQKTRKKIKQMEFSMGLLSCVLLAGCMKTPDMEYVVNKEDQGTLILDNITEDSGIPIVQQVNAPTRVNHTCKTTNEYTRLVIDAAVVTPDCTAIPMYTVSPANFSEETIVNYTNILFETGEFYNREFGSKNRTTDELYEIIGDYQQMLDSAEITDASDPVWDEYGNLIEVNEEDWAFFEEAMKGYESQIPESEDRLTYGSPVSYDFTNHREYANHGVANGVQIGFDYEFQTAAYTGLYNGVEYDLTLYRDGINSELRFLLPRDIRLENGYTLDELYMSIGDSGYMQKPNICRYSEEEAVALCKDFMAELGIEKMEAQYVENVSLVKNHTMNNEEFLGNKGYQIWFVWGDDNMLDGCTSEFDRGLKNMQYRPYTSEVYMQIVNPLSMGDPEEDVSINRFNTMAGFCVMDEGIVDAWILNPMENPELLAENVRLLSFGQVLEQGIAQLEVRYGDAGNRGRREYIKITAICLDYAPMKSPDTEGEYTMVPVWDFKTGGINGVSVLTINAIDGSVFDREQGY